MTMQQSRRPHFRRSGYTLVELTVSLTSATVLSLGLASALIISGHGFDGTQSLHERNSAAEVQSDMMADVSSATSLLPSTATKLSVTVPDRNGDGLEETVTYEYTGLPDAELRYSLNGSLAETIKTQVQDFNFTYNTRLLKAPAYTPPPLDPSQWGKRWVRDIRMGYDTLFTSSMNADGITIATAATLAERARLHTIAAYLTSPAGSYRFGIYNLNTQGNNPGTLLAESAVSSTTGTGWHSLAVPPTLLEPGKYYLVLSYNNWQQKHHYASAGGDTRTNSRDATSKSFSSIWSTHQQKNYTYRVSIFGICTVEP